MEELIGALDSAIHNTIREYVDPLSKQRGAAGLATRLGLQPHTLANKANPLQDGHQLNLRESIPLQLCAGDFRILHAYASALGHCAYEVPERASDVSDVALLDAYAEFHACVGDKAEAIRRALVDNDVSRAELIEIRRCLDAVIRSGLQLSARLEVLAG